MKSNHLSLHCKFCKAFMLILFFVSLPGMQSGIYAQPVNDKCEMATPLPLDAFNGTFYCIEDSIDEADPDPLHEEVFDVSLFPTVWYSFRIFEFSTLVNIHFRSETISWPVLRLFQKSTTCDNLIPVEMREGVDGKAEWIGLNLGYGEYLLAVTSIDANEGTFSLCINNLAAFLEVKQMKVGTPKVEWREYYGPLEGPYFQGELLYLSTTVSQWQDAHGSCSWFQGLVPVFGQSWLEESYHDLSWNSTLNGQSLGQQGNGHYGPSTWDWFEDDVGYHKFSDHLKNGFFEDQLLVANGGLKSTIFDPFVQDYAEDIYGGCCAPCWDPDPGEQLPPGWFCYGIDGSCGISGPPIRYDWGDGGSCSPTNREWSFEFSMLVSDDIYLCDSDRDIDLTLAMYPFMDNTIGSWSDNFDGFYDAYGFKRLSVVCGIPNLQPVLLYPDTILYACYPDSLVLPLNLLGPHLGNVAFWKYSLEGPGVNSTFSGITPNDTLTLFPEPHGSNVIVYEGWIQAFSDPRHMIDQFYVIFKFYKRAPSAEIEWEIINGQVHFSQTTPLHEITSILWDFGDSTTSNVFKPIHTYEKEGPYLVTLIVSNPCGSDTLKEEIFFVRSLPNPQIATSTSIICRGDTIHYSSLTTGYLDSLSWFFEGGDPRNANDSIVSVVYLEAGSFDVSLSAFNPLGERSLLWQDSIQVMDVPVASFSTVASDSLSYCIYTGDLLDIAQWQIGSGPIIENDTLTIENEGFHLITLIVSNICGADTLQEEVLFIRNLPEPRFTVSDYTLCRMDTITYTSISTGWIDSLVWVFDGGSPGFSSDSIVKVVYPDIGLFDISLTAFNAIGEAARILVDTLAVQDPPVPDYSVAIFDSLYYCIYSGPEADVVLWQFNDESIVSHDTLILVVEESGVYPIKLWVENSCGRDSVFFNLHILATATEELETLSTLYLYPNPTKGSLWMVTEQLELPALINIYDWTGRLVWTHQMTSGSKSPFEMVLDQIGVSTGAYLFELRQANISQVRRFVKM